MFKTVNILFGFNKPKFPTFTSRIVWNNNIKMDDHFVLPSKYWFLCKILSLRMNFLTPYNGKTLIIYLQFIFSIIIFLMIGLRIFQYYFQIKWFVLYSFYFVFFVEKLFLSSYWLHRVSFMRKPVKALIFPLATMLLNTRFWKITIVYLTYSSFCYLQHFCTSQYVF